MELPDALQTAIDAELAQSPVRSLARSAADLSERYRAGNGQPTGGRFLRAREDIAAYAAYRLPATFAAVSGALFQVRDSLPSWQPESVLDVGAGPGTAAWAAATVWPSVRRVTLLEQEEGMIALGRRLASYAASAALRDGDWRRADVTGDWAAAPHDLVIVSYAIGELPEDRCRDLIRRLWECTTGALVIVEPGSTAGFRRVREARAQLISAGAPVAAPCPHSRACPLPENDWCHFAQRLARSRLHRQVKGGELPYEDEKYSFVALSRLPVEPIHGRVLRHPQIRSGHIRLQLCTDFGLTNRVVTRRERELYRAARDWQWGSPVPPAVSGHAESDPDAQR